MLDFLFFISAKKAVVSCGIIGALIVSIAPKCAKMITSLDAQSKVEKRSELITKLLTRVGYGFAGLSVILFIIAGFIVDLR